MLFKNKKISDLIHSLRNIVQENNSYLHIIGVFIFFYIFQIYVTVWLGNIDSLIWSKP